MKHWYSWAGDSSHVKRKENFQENFEITMLLQKISQKNFSENVWGVKSRILENLAFILVKINNYS